MQRVMLKSKIHRATVTDCDLHYVGSITIDPDLLEAADILEHEQVHVVDVDNGARFETYTIAGERGSGEMRVNGAAARLVHRGDTIIVISYGHYDEADLERYEPRVVHVEAADQPHHHHRRRGGDPALAERASTGVREEHPCPATPPSRHPTDPGRPADDAAAADREEAPRRPDRDGHRLRLPERPRRRGRRRRPRARRRLGRDDGARLQRHDAGRARRHARARARRAPRPDARRC